MKEKMDRVHLIRQTDYPSLLYPTSIKPGLLPREPYPLFSETGCGICSMCMALEALTGITVPVEEMIEESVRAGANMDGTDMKKLSAHIAGKYHLQVRQSSDTAELLEHLHGQMPAILHVGKPRGLFSDGGHYVTAVRARGEEIFVLDPNESEEKYQKEYRRGLFRRDGEMIVAAALVVREECRYRTPSYYLFCV